MQRIAKFISAAGVCSRREAERLIELGQVKVDGKVIDTPATLVGDGNKIEVEGKLIANHQQEPRLWCYYKPAGLVTSHKDTHQRETVFDNLQGLPRVISVGRLDLNSEGLLLLTNSGKLARHFELPSNKFERVYKVRAYGDPRALLRAKFPVVIDEIEYNVKSIKQSMRGTNSWFEVVLTEGKNREIRKIFDHFGLKVSRLIRIKYGSFSLGNLEPSQYIEQPFNSFKKFLL